MLDRMKDLGFHYSTKAGLPSAFPISSFCRKKQEILDEAQKKVDTVQSNSDEVSLRKRTIRSRHFDLDGSERRQFKSKLMKSLDRINPIIYDE